MGFLRKYEPYFYALLRIIAGFLILWHGAQKLLGFPPMQMPPGAPAPPPGISPLMAVAGTIELVGGILILIGFFAGITAFIASGLMAVAYFMVHFSMAKFLPIQNQGELAVIYCFVFLYIAARGSGILSVDAAMRGNASPPVET
ncbi:MAG TPA: DoxX family protein [Pyrinomonadaceae bacterium]|jgi:putative oxidoreductase